MPVLITKEKEKSVIAVRTILLSDSEKIA